MLDLIEFEVGFITVSVSSIPAARAFYETLLGLRADIWYEPTRWLSFACAGKTVFAIQESQDAVRHAPGDMIDFYVDDVNTIWERVKDCADIVHEPQRTPWGSYKFIVRDPDGYPIAIVKKNK